MRRLIPARLRRRGPSFPAAPAPNLDRLAADLARPPAPLGWVLYFTPRSGASWLCDLATRSGLLGQPDQSFSPGTMARAAARYNARSLDEYCALLPRRQARGKVWGLAVSHPQIRSAFPSERAFLKRFGQLPALWLVRRDIVAQAVSLAKMRATGLAHAPYADAAAQKAADDAFAYDAAAIGAEMARLRGFEVATEAMFARAGIDPLRMSYEENVVHPRPHLIKLIGTHAGRAATRPPALEPGPHTRLATARSHAYAARFRAEEAAQVAEIEAARAPLIEAIRPYGPRNAPAIL
ncbi:Stf0 family sulfotransferase [Jannaschia seohaensis]|uniref:LPS sulfotransferase NodH n=1 Tax=Jannaschia seohaensis TaxID=475081 RepID=A0A2Y9B6W1_9RHOB|nr:Stf0 family sulfotransferase [Jannaschia seohaensis]PWJ12909.1 LPS sulfotransferase NodH [Jannaschia seohaensis]SSA50717.1 LPS sulfotransferase NodH [Jannaschia seohaensis]